LAATAAAGRHGALEASRGALLAAHAACGMAMTSRSREAARMLRAAEGMLRSAIAVLTQPVAEPDAAKRVAGEPAGKPATKPWRKRGTRGSKKWDMDVSNSSGENKLAEGSGTGSKMVDVVLVPRHLPLGGVSGAQANEPDMPQPSSRSQAATEARSSEEHSTAGHADGDTAHVGADAKAAATHGSDASGPEAAGGERSMTAGTEVRQLSAGRARLIALFRGFADGIGNQALSADAVVADLSALVMVVPALMGQG